jgi:hypothetical protein
VRGPFSTGRVINKLVSGEPGAVQQGLLRPVPRNTWSAGSAKNLSELYKRTSSILVGRQRKAGSGCIAARF